MEEISSNDARNPTFTVEAPRTYTFRQGWGVSVTPVHAGEDEPNPDAVVDIDVDVVRIGPDTVTVLSDGTPCVRLPGGDDKGPYVPAENFRELEDLWQDDTHDLRDRWFATEDEAKAHARDVEEGFRNPLPWQPFVVLD